MTYISRCPGHSFESGPGTILSFHGHPLRAARQVTFELIAEEWLALQAKKLAPVTYDKALDAFDVAGCATCDRGTRHARNGPSDEATSGQVFRYAIATGRAERDISVDRRGALAPAATKNHAAIIDPIAIGHLLRAIDGYRGRPVTHAALKLAPLVFVRPGELRHAEWSEIDFDSA